MRLSRYQHSNIVITREEKAVSHRRDLVIGLIAFAISASVTHSVRSGEPSAISSVIGGDGLALASSYATAATVRSPGDKIVEDDYAYP